MEPGPTAVDDPAALRRQQRNAFYHSLPPAAQESFLRAVEEAQARGLSNDAAWEAAVEAAETTYPEEDVARAWPTSTTTSTTTGTGP